MSSDRAFRFGRYVRPSAATPLGLVEATIVGMARRAEEEGYQWVALNDHVIQACAPISGMMAIAGATSRLRVTTMVLDVNVRHPIHLAKETAMIDLVSGGRLELGLGAGSFPFEHSMYLGLDRAPLEARVRRLEEAIQVVKGLWSEKAFGFAGDFYRFDAFACHPKPIQRPHPPLRLGGFGQRSLTLAGRLGDIVNVFPRWPLKQPRGQADEPGELSTLTTKGLAERIDWVRSGADHRFASLELELYMQACVITADKVTAAQQYVPRLGSTVEEVLEAPDVAIGSLGEVADHLCWLRQTFGFSSFVCVPTEVVQLLTGS